MAVKIGHAVMDENGRVDGLLPGDQTGKEIQTATWYNRSGGWGFYLECTNSAMADKAATYMEQICANNNFGYSQRTPNRWSGHKSILSNGKRVAGASGDYDCSSLCVSCYILAGLSHPASGYTGSIRNSLLKTGKFKLYSDPQHLNSSDYAKRGGLYLKEGSHVLMCLSNGSKAGQTTITPTAPTGIKPPYVEVLGSTVNVRSAPDTTKRNGIFIAKRGERYAFDMADPKTGWYGITSEEHGHGYISNLPNLTRLVK